MDSFQQLLDLTNDRSPPPIHRWRPSRIEPFAIRIARDGRWYHENRVIDRRRLCQLFGSLLRVEDGRHFLVTPPTKYLIEVEDAPFIAVDMEARGHGIDQTLAFRTNLDDVVVANDDHPITVVLSDGHPRPYVIVRDGLRALISRSVYYRMGELAVQDAEAGTLRIWSGGTAFSLL